MCRVDHGAQEVERRRHAEFAAGDGGMPHGGVEHLGEAKRDSRLFGVECHAGNGEIQPDAEGLQDVGGSRGGRRRPVAVLDHLGPRARGDQGGHRGDVDRVLLVAAACRRCPASHRRSQWGWRWRSSPPPGRPVHPRSRPWTRSATRNPATWAGVASPDMMEFMAHSVLPAVRSAPLMSALMSRGQVLPAACADA